ncbi:ATP-dependent DNA helicase [Halomonas sp. YLGW01]|uniref:ATP-dependent DNA helicase n=1 Tax=Halomonas sp. YLGW01 TaxID=2773308 RepID=UPI001785C5C4|nr:ATP-dependent DNA helicase [Halomonas sp. YLGW01]
MSLKVAVRALCDFTARRGDLDHRFTPSPTASEGIAGHALIAERRRAADATFETELALEGDYVDETGQTLVVSGRADGFDPTAHCLEEVKTHRGDLARMADNQRALHWAQLHVYGALLCRARGLERLTLSLVYLELGSGRETRLSETRTAAELEAIFTDHGARYMAWARQEAVHRERRDAALRRLSFPFAAFRTGQRPLAEAVYKAASTARALLLQAPTGIGKTLGTLFPMLTAMPRQGMDRLFFLTMKTPGRRLALEALERVDAACEAQDSAPRLRWLELIARDKACEYPGSACHGEACPLARGFYDRLPAARVAAVERGRLDRQALREVALDHAVCPYYLGQELARWCDVVVGDVNHYFDTHALLYALTQAHDWRVGVLVDEAHNLIERARGMYSAELDQRRLAALRRQAPPALKGSLARLGRQWAALWREDEQAAVPDAPSGAAGMQGRRTDRGPDYRVMSAAPGAMLRALHQAATAITDHLAEHPGEVDPALQEFLFEALAFTRLAEAFGDHSLYELTRAGRGRARLALRNLIPAPFLAPRFAASHSAVLFSATLSPGSYFRDLLGLPDATACLEIASPFAGEQLEVRIRRDISTRYAHRQASIEPIVATLHEQFRRAPGNYLAFFSSFAYLEAVATRLGEMHAEIPAWCQTRGMDEAAREAFLARFVPGGQGIGFAVLGGAFAEGVDLPGERLIGAFIATLGLPPVEARQETLRERLEARFGRGFDYAYRYPGLNKVVQAAGRVIRGPEDRGVVVLMDDRFARPEVRALLPGWWRLP